MFKCLLNVYDGVISYKTLLQMCAALQTSLPNVTFPLLLIKKISVVRRYTIIPTFKWAISCASPCIKYACLREWT
jgi:hypothetical protein